MTASSIDTVAPAPALHITDSLEEFQSEEQRQVLDTVAQIRKCGLDAILPLPQIAVCGNQSAGKSSVLEALTEIPFPRNDNLCTRFATEITLRRGITESLRLTIIPDGNRPADEKTSISSFSETIVDFTELPDIMSKAAEAMGITSVANSSSQTSSNQAFARDVLSFEIEGPTRPQLTVVDVPGLIQNVTKGVTEQDRQMVAEITDFYIRQERTICLAVIQATDDYANQPILTKVREVDPEGSRTLGIITKPDRLNHNSESEAAYLALARNEDVFFKLGWHVVKNRKFEEASFSIEERNASEAAFFRNSNFNAIPNECRGIDALRSRLSGLLFEHIKRELPNLRRDLDIALAETTTQLDRLGSTRATAGECRNYLTTLSLRFLETTRAAIDGHYEGDYFQDFTDDGFDIASPQSVKRLRAAIQHVNRDFAETMRRKGPKYIVSTEDPLDDASKSSLKANGMAKLSRQEALAWVARVLVRSRGKEPIGNYNPLIIGELFWELSSKWEVLATDHVDTVADLCSSFTDTLLEETCPRDIQARLAALKITEGLQERKARAMAELSSIVEDKQDFPMVYNHYYTDNVQKARQKRMEKNFGKSIEAATSHHHLPNCNSNHTSATVDIDVALRNFHGNTERDMEKHSCEEALDCLLSMYKTQQKTFVANVTSQVIGRHMLRNLDKLFTPLDVNGLSDEDVMKVAAEPASTRRQRDFLLDRQQKLISGRDIFRGVMSPELTL
ncbi:hypothetical protein M409DRAFT_71374 [Zasmidium cellare ATCC 36951]|uniref:GED domain-containing protein n=1 Tax=Zasmidium cellare ATCC 36951 TaxID=1080233 RepID=A0A6A6BVZ5_ZASCE|nr:uncharacterized protein M409DRAFT_71374 [Zasmidium cellare ATCC 36951]KAF2158961.1 hypothetical protein M409DRAFT_71374 [Zasmidium cellare ATCC 36951]